MESARRKRALFLPPFLYLVFMSVSSSHTEAWCCWSRRPLCGLLTCSWGHGWLKQWQVDSTLKLSIDPRELNQTANPPSLSDPALGGTEEKGLCGGWEGRHHLCVLVIHHSTLLKRCGAAMEEFLTLWCDFKQALWIHWADPAAFWPEGAAERGMKAACFITTHLNSLETLIFNEVAVLLLVD